MSNSPLVNYTRISPNRTIMSNKKNTHIVIHHMSGNLSVEVCGAVFAPATRKASSQYGVGTDGRVGLYCPESDRAWTTGSYEIDSKAVTIEVANDSGAPTWHVSDKALQKTIELCVDICKRNGIKKLNFTGDKTGNLHMHRWYQSTDCPGPYLRTKFAYIADEVNKKLNNVGPDLVVDGYDYALVYNYKYYINKYDDLKKAFGDDQFAAFNHFLKYGMNEGRQAKEDFNVGVYRENYVDLQKAFGNERPKYYRHYIKYGIGERRVANYHVVPISKYKGYDYSLVYDGKYYLDKYADLKKAFGNNYDKLIEHFVNYGMREHRQAKPTFNVDIYKSNYPDLQKAFGNDYPKYYVHYIEHGKKEGRVADKPIKPIEYYTYHTGDQIEDIARSYNISVNELLALNGIRFEDGQKLRVR